MSQSKGNGISVMSSKFAEQANDDWAREIFQSALQKILTEILQADTEEPNYSIRHRLVLMALSVADQAGFKAGIRLDPKEPEWPVAFIELPTGQVSWHLAQHPIPYDGHTTTEKYERIQQWQVQPLSPSSSGTSSLTSTRSIT